MEVLEPEFYIILKSLASTKTSIGSHHRLTKASIADIFQFLKTIPLFEESLNENEEMFFRFVTKLKVKELLPGEELFDEEIKSKPLSDQQICDRLKKEQISLSRRGVAKYRMQMGIPTSCERRER